MPPKLIFFLTALLTPIVLLGFALRLLLTPVFPTMEYNLPWFPPDAYGFTVGDRVGWSRYAVEYLTNREDIGYLSRLHFENGESLFNERELSHMEDVKRVTRGALDVFYLALAGLALLGLWSKRGDQWSAFRQGLKRGGWIMVGIAGAVAAVVAVGMFLIPDLFWTFFSGFHALFFKGDSWLFEYSDTLIRLFPLRFWQDAFLLVALIAVAGGLGLALGIKRDTTKTRDTK
ncbi:MAG: TIGR01906 family membrane protein [Anaerolineales bacterium]|nr:MAG: TIGR01906 family membrane protein [Anaerolineales bacterium]